MSTVDADTPEAPQHPHAETVEEFRAAIAAVRANLDDMTMDLTLSNRPYTIEGAIRAMEREIQILQRQT